MSAQPRKYGPPLKKVIPETINFYFYRAKVSTSTMKKKMSRGGGAITEKQKDVKKSPKSKSLARTHGKTSHAT